MKPGDRVRVLSGALAGQVGVIDDMGDGRADIDGLLSVPVLLDLPNTPQLQGDYKPVAIAVRTADLELA